MMLKTIPISSRQGTGVLFVMLSAVLSILLSLIPVASANALSAETSGPDVEVSVLDNGTKQVTLDGVTHFVAFDETLTRATVTDEHGVQTTVSVPEGMLSGTAGSDVAPTANVTCTFLIWVVETIHTAGWTAALAIVAATGPVGATVLLTMYALGSTAFLVWVSAQC